MKNSSHRNPSNWYVITGGPGCGKTTMVNLLRDRGYNTTIEHARFSLYSTHQRKNSGGEAAQKKIHQLINQVYSSLPFPIVYVPVLPPRQGRVYFKKFTT